VCRVEVRGMRSKNAGERSLSRIEVIRSLTKAGGNEVRSSSLFMGVVGKV